jgi:hypothetical protein
MWKLKVQVLNLATYVYAKVNPRLLAKLPSLGLGIGC